MAILTVDSLLNCSSIPSFLGGSGDTPANPSKMIFQNTNAPLNWVKDTTHNNKALRVTGGANGTALSPGGATAFTTIFTTRSTTVTSGPSPAGISVSPDTTLPLIPSTGTAGPMQTDPTTISSSQFPPHTHSVFDYVPFPGTSSNPASTFTAPFPGLPVFVTPFPNAIALSNSKTPRTTGDYDPSPSTVTTHNHPISAPHTHNITETEHTHTVFPLGDHTHSAPISQDFGILYVDVIIATKG